MNWITWKPQIAERYALRVTAVYLLLLGTLSFSGCVHKPPVLPPGAINSFDATAYDVLMTAQSAINDFKAGAASLSTEDAVKVTPVLDQAIKDYNTAEAAWQAYHAGITKDTSGLSASVQQLITDIAALQQQTISKK